MIVQGLSSYRHIQLKPQRDKGGALTADRTKKASKGRAPRTESPDRSEFLKLVQRKVRNGHYNSDAVLDDLSHSFAGAFDKIL